MFCEEEGEEQKEEPEEREMKYLRSSAHTQSIIP
jgi:hypothetical protein